MKHKEKTKIISLHILFLVAVIILVTAIGLILEPLGPISFVIQFVLGFIGGSIAGRSLVRHFY